MGTPSAFRAELGTCVDPAPFLPTTQIEAASFRLGFRPSPVSEMDGQGLPHPDAEDPTVQAALLAPPLSEAATATPGPSAFAIIKGTTSIPTGYGSQPCARALVWDTFGLRQGWWSMLMGEPFEVPSLGDLCEDQGDERNWVPLGAQAGDAVSTAELLVAGFDCVGGAQAALSLCARISTEEKRPVVSSRIRRSAKSK